MSTEKNNEVVRKRQEALDAKQNEIVENLDNVSLKDVKEAKEEAKIVANKIITDAQAAIEQQKMAALVDVKNQVGLMVIEVSEKILRRELSNKAEQENYVRQLANEVKLN